MLLMHMAASDVIGGVMIAVFIFFFISFLIACFNED